MKFGGKGSWIILYDELRSEFSICSRKIGGFFQLWDRLNCGKFDGDIKLRIAIFLVLPDSLIFHFANILML